MTAESQTPLEIAIDRLVRTDEFIRHKHGCNGLQSKCTCGLGLLRTAILDGVHVLNFEMRLVREKARTAEVEIAKLRSIPNADEWAERIDRDTGCGLVARQRIADALRAMHALGEAQNAGEA